MESVPSRSNDGLAGMGFKKANWSAVQGGAAGPQKTIPRRSLEHHAFGCQGQSKRVSRKLIDYPDNNTDTNNRVSDAMMLIRIAYSGGHEACPDEP
jgi:hypothetical protein